jgi:hypothetical protein
MRNNIIQHVEADSAAFKEYFLEYLAPNLSKKLCNSISNLLALDYANRLKSKPELPDYINLCTLRLKKHLSQKIITDESFSSAMSLFAIAITPEKNIDADDDKAQKQSQDAVIDAVIATHFVDLSPDEVILIKSLIKDLLNGKDGKEMLNMISSNPKLFYSQIVAALRENKKQEEMLESIHQHLTKVLSKDKQVKKQHNEPKGLLGKLFLIGGLMLAASTGLVIGGLALPALIVPLTAAAVKFAPILGEQLTNTLAKKPIAPKQESKVQISQALNNKKQESSILKNQEKTVVKSLDKQQIKNLILKVDPNTKTLDQDTNKSKKVLDNRKKTSTKERNI